MISSVSDIAVCPDPAAALIVFAAGDSRYLSLFAKSLVRSIRANAGVRTAIHLHAVNPDPATLALLFRLKAEGVASTVESVDLGALNERQRRTYYSAARFRRLPDILARYILPVVTVDLDQIVVGPIGSLVTGGDVGLIRYEHGAWNLLSMFSASVVCVQPTPGGRQFANSVRDYLDARISEGALNWHLDQAALAVCCLKAVAATGFRFYPPSIMHSAIDGSQIEALPPETLFWSLTYSVEANAANTNTARFKAFCA